jgi:hypothetical protein
MKKKHEQKSQPQERMVSRAPAECRGINQVCALRRDNLTIGDWWMLTDGYQVTLTEQKIGNAPKQQINLPTALLNKFIKWWNTKQRPLRG